MILRLVVVFTAGIALVVGLIVFISSRDHEAAVETVAALDWVDEPRAYEQDRLPRDRVVIGRIRNTGGDPIDASADDFEVRDAQGRELFANLQFIDAFAERPDDSGQAEPPEEQLKIGADLELQPGASAPLTVRYRLDRKAVPPASVYFKEVEALDLPGEPSAGG